MKGAGGVAAANLLARVTGMVREMVVSAVFGAGAVTDAFNAALRVPQLLRELLAEGSLQNAYVPAFSDASEKEGAAGAWQLANAFLGVLLLALGAATLVFLFGAPLWVRVVANGFADDPEKLALTVTLTRWLSPFLAGLSIAGFLGAMLNVKGRFFWPALAGNALNLLVIAGALLAAPFERLTGQPAIVAVAIATTLSGFVQVGITVPPLLKLGWRPRPTLGGHPGLGKMLRYLGPALIGISTVQFNLLVETQWASTYGDGALTWLTLAFRLVQLPLAVISGSVATAALAVLSQHAARGEHDALGAALTKALRVNAFWVIPSAVGLGVLAAPLCRLFFERGAFTAADTAGTAAMLQMYAIAVYGICFHRVAVPAYYAMGDPKTPMRLSLWAMAAKIPTILLLTRGFGMGVEALPLSHALTVTGESALLVWGLQEKVRGRGLLGAHVKMGLAAVVLGAVAYALVDHLHVVLVCALAGVAYLGVARILGVWEGLGRPRGLPPFLDPDTRAALEVLAKEPVVAVGDTLVSRAGTWRMIARDGAFALVPAAGSDDPTPQSFPEPARKDPLAIIVRVGRAPSMRGLQVGERTWSVVQDTVVEGPCEGPRIPVP
ncbi:MAG: murein biosynthesis integral membrane protein MurJ [Pseudomonadota bacterium]|nr:murein biosynthesis integral membrane protein MurJ [Pseudomonadota bacterium]